jgi:Ni/Co efflux regulator RcnB
MKKLILSAVAATMVMSPIAAAPALAQHRTVTTVRHNDHNGRTVITERTVRGPGNQYRNWRKGERFDRRYARNYGVVDYHRYRGLRTPPRGYHWVRSGNDAVLVGITSGIIASVIAGAIR